jgi:hypothetical protein
MRLPFAIDVLTPRVLDKSFAHHEIRQRCGLFCAIVCRATELPAGRRAALQRPAGTAGRNFRKHRGRLLEDVDYCRVPASQLANEPATTFVAGSKHTSEDIILLTESGYLMLVKSFRDDLAWEVQRALVNASFRSKEKGAADLPSGDLLQRQSQAATTPRARTAAGRPAPATAPRPPPAARPSRTRPSQNSSAYASRLPAQSAAASTGSAVGTSSSHDARDLGHLPQQRRPGRHARALELRPLVPLPGRRGHDERS